MRHEDTNKKRAARKPALALRPVTACVLAALAQCAVANPNGHQVGAGSATVQASGKTLTVTNTPGTIINWQSFSIAPGELTKFVQQSSASAVLNRVVAANPSNILGTLQSNGRVFLVNPHGIVVGAGALIDTAGFVASTLNIADKDFLAGKLRFEGGGAGALRNEGTIQATGDIFLVGPNIENAASGIIQSASGAVVLAAGKSITITSPDAHGVQFGIQAPEDSVVNLGKIQASNAVGLFGGTLRHSGEIKVTSASLDSAGRVVLSAQKDTILSGNSTIAVDNSVGRGGSVQVLGERVGLFGSSTISATGAAGGGEILIGGDYRGENASVRNAFTTWLGPNAKLDASATARGDGGRVIVWADDITDAHGYISVRGGAGGGNGGFVETSGKRVLVATRAPEIGAPAGKAGTWLLDPENLRVTDCVGICANQAVEGPAGTFRPPNDTAESLLDIDTLETRLNAGGEVILWTEAVTPSVPGRPGDIIFDTRALTVTPPAGGSSLRLRAHNDIDFNNGITRNAGGDFTILFRDNNDGPLAGTATVRGGITNNGGNLIFDGPFTIANGTVQSFTGSAVTFDVGQTITVDGAITLSGINRMVRTATGANLVGTNNAHITIQTGGQFDIQTETGREIVPAAGVNIIPRFTLQSGATLRKTTNTGTTNFGWQFHSTGGSVIVESGRLNFSPGDPNMVSTAVGGSTAIFKADGVAGTILDLNAANNGAYLDLGNDVSIQAANAGSVVLSSTTAQALRFSGTGTGTSLESGGLDLTGKTVGGAGKLTVKGTSVLTMNNTRIMGSLATASTGTVSVSGSTASQIDGGLTLGADSTLSFDDPSVQTQLILTAGPAPTFAWNGGLINAPNIGGGGSGLISLNNGTITVGGGLNTLNAGITLDNSTGTTTINAGSTLTVNGGTLNAGIFNNNGGFQLSGGATQNFTQGGASNGGTFTADGGTTINFNNNAAPYNFTGASSFVGPGSFGLGANATLNVNGGTLTMQNAAVTTNPAATVTILPGAAIELDNATLTANGLFHNRGTFSLTSAGSIAHLLGGGVHSSGTFNVIAGDTIEFGGGQHTLDTTALDGAGLYDLSAGSLHAAVTTTNRRRGGELRMRGGTTINGQGTLNIENTASLEIFGTGTKTFGPTIVNNDGPTNVLGGTMNILSGTFNARGPTNVTGGTLQIQGGAFNASDTVALSPNTSVFVTGTGAFTTLPTAAFNLDPLASLQVHVNGLANLQGGGTLRGVLQPVGTGIIDLSGGTFSLDGTQFTGTGTLVQSGGIANVTNNASSNVNLFRLTGESQFNVNAGQTFNMTGGTLEWLSGGIGGTGTFTAQPGAVVTFPGAGARVFNGPAATINALNLAGGTLTMNGGTVTVAGATNIAAGAELLLQNGAASTLNTQGAFDVSGTLTNNARVNNTNAVAIQAGGVVRGGGIFGGDVNNIAGILKPGGSPGHLTVANYTQGANGTLEIEIGGTQQGFNYDWLEVLGTATLDGTLRVRSFGGYVPSAGEIYNFLTYARLVGNFSNFDVQGFVLPTAGPFGFTVSSGGGLTTSSNSASSTASADVLALKEEEKTNGEMIEELEEDKNNKEKGAVCT